MARPVNPDSERSIAARLTIQLGRAVTRKCVQEWKEKGYPLDDPKRIEHLINMQNRGPKQIVTEDAAETEEDSPDVLDIETELKKLQEDLIRAPDYNTAKKLTMQIKGVNEVLKSLRMQGHYVTEESQRRDGMAFSEAVKALVLKIPSDLPQMIIGLDYADAVAKCEDYAYAILTSLHETREGALND